MLSTYQLLVWHMAILPMVNDINNQINSSIHAPDKIISSWPIIQWMSVYSNSHTLFGTMQIVIMDRDDYIQEKSGWMWL